MIIYRRRQPQHQSVIDHCLSHSLRRRPGFHCSKRYLIIHEQISFHSFALFVIIVEVKISLKNKQYVTCTIFGMNDTYFRDTQFQTLFVLR